MMDDADDAMVVSALVGASGARRAVKRTKQYKINDEEDVSLAKRWKSMSNDERGGGGGGGDDSEPVAVPMKRVDVGVDAIPIAEVRRQTNEIAAYDALSLSYDNGGSLPDVVYADDKVVSPPEPSFAVQPLVGNRANNVRILPRERRCNVKRKFDGESSVVVAAAAVSSSSSSDVALATPTIGIATFSQVKHLQHVMRVLETSTPFDSTGKRVWLGFGKFLDYYFASTFGLFLGDRAVLRVIRIPSHGKFGAKFFALTNNRYSLLLLADFDYWDRMLQVAVGLPDIYFEHEAGSLACTYQRLCPKRATVSRPSVRLHDDVLTSYADSACRSSTAATADARANSFEDDDRLRFVIRDGNATNHSLGVHEQTVPPPSANMDRVNSENDDDDDDDDEQLDVDNAAVLDVAVSALCLAHRFEMLLHRDLSNKVPHYVTLAKMFTRNTGSVNPFRINLFSN